MENIRISAYYVKMSNVEHLLKLFFCISFTNNVKPDISAHQHHIIISK